MAHGRRLPTGLAAGLLLCGLTAAVEVPGWDYPPLPGTARKTPESLVRVFEDVFDDEMLAAIDAEIPALDHLAANSGALRNHKRVTFWRGRNARPRFGMERMVKLLEDLTFPKELGGVFTRSPIRPNPPLVGFSIGAGVFASSRTLTSAVSSLPPPPPVPPQSHCRNGQVLHPLRRCFK